VPASTRALPVATSAGPASDMLAEAKPRTRVNCSGARCTWSGYRVNPKARPCPRCGADVEALWLAGQAPSSRTWQVYLAHFEPRLAHAGHYLGTSSDVRRREVAHLAGRGARIIAAAIEAGCEVTIVRTWPGGRELEASMKKRGNSVPGKSTTSTHGRGAQSGSARLCPLCTTPAVARRRRYVPGQWLIGDPIRPVSDDVPMPVGHLPERVESSVEIADEQADDPYDPDPYRVPAGIEEDPPF
jgi:predicted GIY-YIG superfamily endonuclease